MTFLPTLEALKHISNTHSHSSLMGHFKPTPQNGCWAQCVIMMLLSVTEGLAGLSQYSCRCVSATSLCVPSDLSVRLHRSVPVLAAVLRRRHHHPEGRGPGDHRSGQVDRLQVPRAHRSPGQGKTKTHSTQTHLSRDEDIDGLSFPQSLKKELDSLLEDKIRNPAPVDWQNCQSKDCAVITAIIDLITTQEKAAGSTKDYGRRWESAPRGQHIYFMDDDDDDDE